MSTTNESVHMNCLIDHPEIVCTVAFIKEAKVSVSHNPLFLNGRTSLLYARVKKEEIDIFSS